MKNLLKYSQFLILESGSDSCPIATQNLEINTRNRDKAIQADYVEYGPLNVDEPGDYWEHLAEHWKTTVDAAKSSLCGNCVAFDVSPRMKECMPGETSDGDGELGYCWMHHFKCHSARSCYTWAKGGPITDDPVSADWQDKNKQTIHESNRVMCSNCSHSWPLNKGGNKPYLCHECNHTNTPENLNEKRKTKNSPDWHDSDAPDANGKFKELGVKELAKWLIRTRGGDMRKITGSLNQQIVFNRNDNPTYAKKMESVRAEVKRQLGKKDNK